MSDANALIQELLGVAGYDGEKLTVTYPNWIAMTFSVKTLPNRHLNGRCGV